MERDDRAQAAREAAAAQGTLGDALADGTRRGEAVAEGTARLVPAGLLRRVQPGVCTSVDLAALRATFAVGDALPEGVLVATWGSPWRPPRVGEALPVFVPDPSAGGGPWVEPPTLGGPYIYWLTQRAGASTFWRTPFPPLGDAPVAAEAVAEFGHEYVFFIGIDGRERAWFQDWDDRGDETEPPTVFYREDYGAGPEGPHQPVMGYNNAGELTTDPNSGLARWPEWGPWLQVLAVDSSPGEATLFATPVFEILDDDYQLADETEQAPDDPRYGYTGTRYANYGHGPAGQYAIAPYSYGPGNGFAAVTSGDDGATWQEQRRVPFATFFQVNKTSYLYNQPLGWLQTGSDGAGAYIHTQRAREAGVYNMGWWGYHAIWTPQPGEPDAGGGVTWRMGGAYIPRQDFAEFYTHFTVGYTWEPGSNRTHVHEDPRGLPHGIYIEGDSWGTITEDPAFQVDWWLTPEGQALREASASQLVLVQPEGADDASALTLPVGGRWVPNVLYGVAPGAQGTQVFFQWQNVELDVVPMTPREWRILHSRTGMGGPWTAPSFAPDGHWRPIAFDRNMTRLYACSDRGTTSDFSDPQLERWYSLDNGLTWAPAAPVTPGANGWLFGDFLGGNVQIAGGEDAA